MNAVIAVSMTGATNTRLVPLNCKRGRHVPFAPPLFRRPLSLAIFTGFIRLCVFQNECVVDIGRLRLTLRQKEELES